MLGPTAEYVGGEVKHLVERCNINLTDVFKSSLRKGAEKNSGNVNARTAKAVLDDAAYCDDYLVKDYYGGLLCASKCEDGDDAALSYVSLLRGMSTLQVKTHFLIYANLHRGLAGTLPSITLQAEREKVRITLSLERYFSFIKRGTADPEAVINHVVSGLLRADLIAPFFQYGSPESINERFPELEVKVPSLVVGPSILGAELFLWAAGLRDPNPNLIIQSSENLLSRYPDEYQSVV